MHTDTPYPSNDTAAILIIGDEILSGRTQDTNIHTIAKFLTSVGVDLKEVRIVGDEKSAIIANLNALRATYSVVLTTGGIGPTHDDITADCVAEAFGVELIISDEAILALEARAKALGAELNDNSRRMARIPKGARLIKNPVSAAPGIHIENVFVMAGVPKIMAAMLGDVLPYLRQGQATLSRTLRLSFVGESWAADVLRSLDHDYGALSFGSYPYGLYQNDEYGTNLVVRGRDKLMVDEAFERLKRALEPVITQARLRQPKASAVEIET